MIDEGFHEGSAILIQFFEFILHWNGKCGVSERLWLTAFAERGILALFARVESSRLSVLNSLVNDVMALKATDAKMSHHNVNEVSFRLLNTLCHSYPSFILSSIPTIKVCLPSCVSHRPSSVVSRSCPAPWCPPSCSAFTLFCPVGLIW